MKTTTKKLFKHQALITAVSVFAIVIVMIGSSYAIFSSTSKADEYNVLKVGKLEISYVDTGDGFGDVLSLNGAYPISDEEGAKLNSYRFSVTNTGTITADFKIKVLNDEAIVAEDGCESNLLDFKYIKYKLDNNAPKLLNANQNNEYVIYEATNLLPSNSEVHELRIWIDENASNEILGKHFHGKIVVESIQAGVDNTLLDEYKVGTAVTLKDGSKWHVLENSNSQSATVTLLSDYNLNADGTYNTTCGKNINNTTICSPQVFDLENSRLTDTNSYCTTPETGCNMYEQNGSSVIKDSTVRTWLETTYLPLLTKSLTANSATVDDLTVTLPTMEQLATADSQNFNQNQITFNSDWITSTSYLTKTASSINTSYVWSVVGDYNNSYVQNANDATKSGIRPVITTSKQNIQ